MSKLAKGVLYNNLIVLLTHVGISFITFFMVALPVFMMSMTVAENGVASLLIMVPALLVGIYMYISAGSKFLKPLPRRNALSVSFLAIFFMTHALLGVCNSLFGPVPLITTIMAPVKWFLNVSFCYIQLLESFLMSILGFNDKQAEETALYIIMFLTATVPSLSMYVGLRLKIRKQKKEILPGGNSESTDVKDEEGSQ